jgi:hypothetical protein
VSIPLRSNERVSAAGDSLARRMPAAKPRLQPP